MKIELWISVFLLAIMAWWFLPELLLSVLIPIKRLADWFIAVLNRAEPWLIQKREWAKAELEKLDAAEKEKRP